MIVFTRAMLASAGISCCHVYVRLSVCLSQVGVLLKQLKVVSRQQRHMIAEGLSFTDAENLGETQPGSLATNAGG